MTWRAVLAMLVALAGCASAPPRSPEVEPPRMIDTTRPLAPPPRLALVLGGGSVRGFAHVGVFKALSGVRPGPGARAAPVAVQPRGHRLPRVLLGNAATNFPRDARSPC